eukprot:5182461-Prymnesium_polylepis.1
MSECLEIRATWLWTPCPSGTCSCATCPCAGGKIRVRARRGGRERVDAFEHQKEATCAIDHA